MWNTRWQEIFQLAGFQGTINLTHSKTWPHNRCAFICILIQPSLPSRSVAFTPSSFCPRTVTDLTKQPRTEVGGHRWLAERTHLVPEEKRAGRDMAARSRLMTDESQLMLKSREVMGRNGSGGVGQDAGFLPALVLPRLI